MSATGSPPAAAGGAAPNVALPPAASPLPMPDLISMQAEIDRMAIQAGMQAATMQVQAAELKAQAADLKYQALAMQMKEAAHTADMRELTLQMQLRDAHAETALAIERAEHAAALAVMTRTATVPPGPIMVTASYEREKFIGRQLVPFTTAAYIEANRIRPGTSAETISEVALTLLSALTAVDGREQYAGMVGALLNLSLQLDASSAGSVAQVTVRSITAMLAGETDGASEMEEDSMSTIGSSSSASDSPPPPRRDIFDGKGADKRRKAFHALQAVLCGVGDVVHPCMVHWAAIDRSLLTILKSLVPATATVMYKVVQRQSTFVGGLEAILLLNGHGIQNRLNECFEVVTQTVDYADTDGTFAGVTATDAMHALIADFQARIAAFEVAKDNSTRFCLQQALKSFPTAIDGEIASVFNDLKRDLRKADVSSSTEAVIDIILTTIHTVGATELTGTIIAAVPRQRRNQTILPIIETAASTIYVGGRGGNGGTGKGRGKGTGSHRPLCLHGPKCKNFGTWTGCSSLHTDEDRTEMQRALGDKFVSRDMRMRSLALQAENQPTAVQPHVPPIAQRPAQQPPDAPQQGPPAVADKSGQAVAFLAALKQAQDDYSGAAVSAQRHFAISSLPIMPETSRAGSLDAVIPPGSATSRVIDVSYDMLLVENAQLRNVITILAACDHHAATSLPSSPLYEQPVSAAMSLISMACSDNINVPIKISGDDPNAIIMPAIIDAALPSTHASHVATDTIRAIHVATGPKRTMRANHMTSRGEWTGATMPTTMGVSRTVLQQARIENAERMAASNEHMQPHCVQCPHSLLRHTTEGSRSGRCGHGKYPCGRN